MIRNRNPKILSIQVTADGFSFSILDTETAQIIGIDALPTAVSDTAALQMALEAHGGLDATTQRVILTQNHRQFTLVPNAFYDEGRLRALLGCELSDRDVIRTDHLQSMGLHVPYVDGIKPQPGGLANWQRMHFLSAFLNFVSKGALALSPRCVFAHQYQGLLSVLVFRDADLLLANNYDTHETADTLYYLLALYDNFSLSPEHQALTLSGELSGDAASALGAYFGELRPLDGFRIGVHPEESAKPLGLIQTHQIILE